MDKLKVDLMSFSAHKIYGPKGIGALYVRRKPRVRLEAQMHGGGHERGMRSGTLPTHQIVGMGMAFRLAREEMAKDNERLIELRNRLWDGLKDKEEIYLNGDLDQRIAGILNISFNYVVSPSYRALSEPEEHDIIHDALAQIGYVFDTVHMQRDVGSGASAVLAGVIIPPENLSTGETNRRAWPPDHLLQTND